MLIRANITTSRLHHLQGFLTGFSHDQHVCVLCLIQMQTRVVISDKNVLLQVKMEAGGSYITVEQ